MVRPWVLAALILLLWAAPAQADPISAAVVSFIGLTGTAAAVGTFVVNTVLSVGASVLVGSLFRPKAPATAARSAQERQASVLNLSVGETPREVLFGRAGTGGSLLDAFTYGGDYGTDWLVRVIAIADHRCDALEGFYLGDQFVSFAGSGEVSGYHGQLVVEWLPGTEDQALPEWFLLASAEAQGEGAWSADDNAAGVAVAIVAVKADAPDAEEPVWSSGLPELLFVVRGKLCYDPRHDSTVEGGEGAQRWEDPSTWAYSENAAVCAYNWRRGVFACDRVDQPDMLLAGRGLSIFEAPPERMFAAANLCDESVEAPNGTEARYRVGGVIRASETFEEVERLFAAAMGGFLIQPAGGIEVEPGQAKTPVAEITDEDLVVGAEVSFSAFKSDSQRVNTVIPRYVEPSQRWADHAADICRDFDAIALDGRAREETLVLSLVTSRSQAKRLADIRLRQARLERTATVVLPPRAGFPQIEAGDWIELTSDRYLGGETVVFRVVADGLGGDWRNTLALEETHFDVYGYGGPGTEAGAQTFPPPPDALILKSVTAVGFEMEGSTGALVPAVRFGWETPVDAGITRIRAELRLNGETETAKATTEAVNGSPWVVTEGVPADAVLQVRLVPLGAPGRPIVPSPWITVATGRMISSVQQQVDAAIAEAEAAIVALNAAMALANAEIDAAQAAIDINTKAGLQRIVGEELVHEFSKRVDRDKESVALAGLREILQQEGLRTYVASETRRTDRLVQVIDVIGVFDADAMAFILNSDLVRLSEGESLAQRLTTIAANIATNAAAITTEQTARATEDAALASSITSLTATVSGVSASVAINAAALATLEGQAYGRLMLTVAAGDVVTGMELLSASGPTTISAIRFRASKVSFYDDSGGEAFTPIFFDVSNGWLFADELRAREANIQNAAISVLKIGNGAISDGNSAQNTGTISVSVGSDVDLLSCGITCQTAQVRVHIDFTTFLNPITSAPMAGQPTQIDWVELSILRNGSEIYRVPAGTGVELPDDVYLMAGGMTSVSWADEPGAGTHTYTIRAHNLSASPGTADFRRPNVNVTRYDR